MPKDLKINPNQLNSVDTTITGGKRCVEYADDCVVRSSLDGSVSRMSGLDQLGVAHGHVMTGAIGSAHHTHEDFRQQFEWVSTMLQKTGRAINLQNTAMQRMLLPDGQPVPAQEITLTFPTRPARNTSDFPFTRPIVIRQPTLAAVEADLTSTNTPAIDNAAASWIDAATQADQWADILTEAASDLAANNTGDWVDEAAARMHELADQSRTYATNARTMSTTIGLMSLIPDKHQLQVQAARRLIDLITEPAHRTAAEQAYLQVFYTTYEADLQYAVPPIRNLTMPAAHTTGNQDAQIGMGGAVTAGTGMDTATHLARSSIGAGASALADLPGGVSPTVAASHTPTSPVAGMVGPGGAAPTTGGGMASPLTTLMRHGIEPPRSITDPRGPAGATTTGRPGLGGVPMGSGGHTTIGGRPPASGPIGQVTHPGGPLSSPFSRGGVAGPGGAGGAFSSPGSRGFSTGVPGGYGTGTGAAASSRGMGGMPMGAAPMGTGPGGRQSQGKVKRVTSKVEYSKNLRDLLGEARPVIPGVIGSWVRDQ